MLKRHKTCEASRKGTTYSFQGSPQKLNELIKNFRKRGRDKYKNIEFMRDVAAAEKRKSLSMEITRLEGELTKVSPALHPLITEELNQKKYEHEMSRIPESLHTLAAQVLKNKFQIYKKC